MRIVNGFLVFGILTTLLNAVDFDKRLEMSYVNTAGNSTTSTFSGKVEIDAQLNEDQEIKTKGTYLNSKNDEKTSADKFDLELDYNHMIGDRLYTYLGANYIKDKLSDYESRLNIGPGLGYKFINTDIEVLDIQGGLDYAFDRYTNGEKDDYFAPRTQVVYKYKIRENIQLKQMFSYLVSLEDTKKYFFTSESGVAVKMLENLSLGASYRIDYVNQTQKKNTDRKFLTSLIFDF